MIVRKKCFLRPIGEQDRERIYRWRNSERIRMVMFNQSLITPEEHATWFDRILRQSSAQYLVFELDERPVGFVNFPDIDPSDRSCRWGFYRGEPDTPSEAGLAMGTLALEHAFGPLALNLVIGESLTTNKRGLRLHERLMFIRNPDPLVHRPSGSAIVEFRMSERRWREVRPALQQSIFDEVNPGKELEKKAST